MDKSVWSALSTRLNYHECTALNLGYRGVPELTLPAAKAIYITHSLGTMWALENHAEHMAALITINGFHSFKSFADPRALRAMKTRLAKDPEQQMQEFFKEADIEASPKGLDSQNLMRGLDTLSEGDNTATLKSITCPVLALIGESDQIVPIEAAQKQWLGYDLKICEKGGHALPVTHTNWCAEQIEKFLS